MTGDKRGYVYDLSGCETYVKNHIGVHRERVRVCASMVLYGLLNVEGFSKKRVTHRGNHFTDFFGNGFGYLLTLNHKADYGAVIKKCERNDNPRNVLSWLELQL